MIQAVRAVVHQNERPEKAFELYKSLKNEQSSRTKGQMAETVSTN
jgi:hypothetical protein